VFDFYPSIGVYYHEMGRKKKHKIPFN